MKTPGGLGAVFATATITADTLSFHENTPSADTIEDSASGLLDAGFINGMSITITGSASNNKTVTINTVTESLITLIASDDLTEEAEGATVTIATPTQGCQILGFSDFSLADAISDDDSTTFEDYPYETFMTLIKSGNITMTRFWLTTDPKGWLGRTLNLMMFLRYSATPSASDPAVYQYGDGVILGENITSDLRRIVRDAITLKYNGTVTDEVKTTSW